MRTIVFSAVAMALVSSCTSSEIDEIVNKNNEPVAIQLSAGVQANVVAGTRAEITTGSKFKPTILGWEAKTTPDYTTSTPWVASTAEDIDGAASSTAITLNPVKYYNADADINTFMKAFYVSDVTPTVVTDKAYQYTFENTDGAKDILLSNVISGNKTTATILNFSFKHPLSQVSFKVIAGTGLADGTTLTSITLKNVELPVGLDLSGDDASITYADAADLNVSNISVPVIDKTEVVAGDPVMIAPISELKLDIVTSTGTFKDVIVKLKDDATALLAGTAYTITLTFNQKAITGTASVEIWASEAGSAVVE
ncbi:fimbrillin family protein [Bacteroides sp.]